MRVLSFDTLSVEMDGLLVEDLPEFHTAVAVHPRSWQIVRWLFGVCSQRMKMADDPEDFRIWSWEEVMAKLGLTRPKLRDEVDNVRGIWKSARKIAVKEAMLLDAPKPKSAPSPDGNFELQFPDENLLKKYGYTSLNLSLDDKEWFVGRVSAMKDVLKNPMAEGVARGALDTELRIRRASRVLSNKEQAEENYAGTKEWRDAVKFINDLQDNYQKAITKLDEWVDWAGLGQDKMKFQAQVTTINKAIQEYQSRGDTKLIDGVHTLGEVSILCRRSVQDPEPRYRASMAMHVAMAKQGCYDPNWQCPIPHALFKRWDQTWREVYLRKAIDEAEALPDLMADGPAGEYPEPVYADTVNPGEQNA